MVVDFPEWLNWTRYKTQLVLTRMWLAAAGSVDWHNHYSRHCQCSFQNPSILCLCFPIFTGFAPNCPHLQLFLRKWVLRYWDHLAHTDKEPEMLPMAAIRPTNGSGVWKPSKPVSGWKNSEAYFIPPRSFVGSVKLSSTGFALNHALVWVLPLLCPTYPTISLISPESTSLINHMYVNTHPRVCFWTLTLLMLELRQSP